MRFKDNIDIYQLTAVLIHQLPQPSVNGIGTLRKAETATCGHNKQKTKAFFHRKIRTGKQVPGVAKLSIINLEFSLSQNKVATKILLAYNRVLGKNLGRTLEENASFEKQIGTVSNA